jgi:hypothetical protein
MVDQGAPDPQFDAMTARLLRREALRRASEELNTTSAPGLEDTLVRISAYGRGRRSQGNRRRQDPGGTYPKAAGIGPIPHGT